MAKKPKSEQQMDLINVGPTHGQEVLHLARKYKQFESERVAAVEAKRDVRQEILDYVHKEKLHPVDGVIKFRIEGVEFCVTPRDESLQIKFPVDDED